MINSRTYKPRFFAASVRIDDLGNYIDVKRVCYKKYVDEYYGGWIENVQIKINANAFNDMMKETCFQKLLLNNVPVGFFAYNEKEFKSNPARNLYKRFGFDKYSETETHYLMRHNPIKS